MPFLNVQNIENTQNAAFFIDFIADFSTTFASNCTQNLTGSSLNCASAPLSADTGFTAAGFAVSGPYNSTSVSGLTTSGNTVSGQLCLTDVLSDD